MVWLVTHIWSGLALAAFFGLLFGWAFRGIRLKGQARDAIVQRDIALTELDQTRLELDQLYAAQSKGKDAAAQAGDETLRAELEAREEKLQALSQELTASRDELETLKSKAVLAAGASAVVAGATATAVTGASEADVPPAEPRLDADLNINDAALEWRNRYLASRVRALESTVDTQESTDTTLDDAQAGASAVERLQAELEQSKQAADQTQSAFDDFKQSVEADKQKAIAAALAASAASVAVGAALANKASSDETPTPLEAEGAREPDLGMIKQGWQNTYLRTRLAGAQADISAAPTLLVAEPAEETNPASEAVATLEAPADTDAVTAEKERWQTQYLAHRLAYLENNPIRERAPQEAESAREAETLEATEPEALDKGADLDLPQASADFSSEATPVGDPGELEQELARLRWRNRYLEGRLAYIDGGAPKTEAELVAGAPQDDISEADAPAELAEGSVSEVSVAPADITPADAVLAAMEGIASPSEPGNGAENKDDLTKIDGIDAEMASALNAIGIQHYHQIADLTPDRINEINAQFEDKGQSVSENWISQAGALSLGLDLDNQA